MTYQNTAIHPCLGLLFALPLIFQVVANTLAGVCQDRNAEVPLLILASVSQGRHNVIVSARVVVAVQVRYNGTSTRHSDRDMLKVVVLAQSACKAALATSRLKMLLSDVLGQVVQMRQGNVLNPSMPGTL